MLSRNRKIFYLILTGFLTSTAVSACYWQTSRYFTSRQRWKLIQKQLSKQKPDLLNNMKNQDKFAMKYVQIHGKIGHQYMLISRAREGRMGNLVVRAIQFVNQKGQNQYILAVQGWIPEKYKYTPQKNGENFKGILRQKQKTDYLHTKLKAQDIQKFNISTYIDVDKAIKLLNLQNKNVHTKHYIQILKDVEHSQQKHHYPYQYSIDNFQLPYLTPDKHRGYALFWGLTTTVGLSAIYKVLKMK